MAKIYGNTVGATGGLPKSFLLETEDGVQLVGVTVGEETVFDATDNDVREGKIYASDNGVSTGTKNIPSYHTTTGYRLITSGSTFATYPLANLNLYDFTELQVIICPFVETVDNSTAAEKVVINENVYVVNSNEPIATVIRDGENKTINLGIINDSEGLYLMRYFTYKETD